jgi:hypothetical protein
MKKARQKISSSVTAEGCQLCGQTTISLRLREGPVCLMSGKATNSPQLDFNFFVRLHIFNKHEVEELLICLPLLPMTNG